MKLQAIFSKQEVLDLVVAELTKRKIKFSAILDRHVGDYDAREFDGFVVECVEPPLISDDEVFISNWARDNDPNFVQPIHAIKAFREHKINQHRGNRLVVSLVECRDVVQSVYEKLRKK